MSIFISKESRDQFERMGTDEVRKIAGGVDRNAFVRQAKAWLVEQEKRITEESRDLSIRAVRAEESQAESAKSSAQSAAESARHSRAAAAAAWWAVGFAFVTFLMTLISLALKN
ncbi:hypothetical protein [Dokdonella immobilis]|uniref:hypothetical protein n=1 Tax=Dokdonella immobilis TaxID=578942 RepID=UPI000B8036FC|nr:hypothetical protein [Dokdonella immobilis]